MTVAGSRREARERALGLLYEAEAKGEAPSAVLTALPVDPDPYAARLVSGVEAHQVEIDGLLGRFARGWKLERMPAVDRAVLRVATYELLAEPGVPTPAVVSEAVELASQYSTDESGRFVNGLLARIATEVRGEGGPLTPLSPTADEGAPVRSSVRPTRAVDADVVEEVEAGPAIDEEAALGEAAPGRGDDARGTGVPGPPPAPGPGRRPRPPLPLPQPPLGDGVVRLRAWRPADAPALVAAWSDRDIARWSPPPSGHTLVDAKRWIDGTPQLRKRGLALDLVIAAVGPGDRVLGEVGLSDFDDDRATIGYWVGAGDRGRGHATRAVRMLSTWALQHLGLAEVRATVDQANRASLAVLRRAGFRAETPDLWIVHRP